jgi:hypothetical protein
MRAMIILGVLLILLGMAILSYQWMNHRMASTMFNSAEILLR